VDPTKIDITTLTGLLTTAQMPTNSSSSAGMVTKGTNNPNMFWGTDVSGNPTWRSGLGGTLTAGVVPYAATSTALTNSPITVQDTNTVTVPHLIVTQLLEVIASSTASNIMSYLIVTNLSVITSLSTPSLTLNGDTRTAWPSGGGGGVVGTVSNNVVANGLLAVDGTKTNAIAATAAHVTNALGYIPVNRAGDTMTGTLNMNGTNAIVDVSGNITNAGNSVSGAIVSGQRFVQQGAADYGGTTNSMNGKLMLPYAGFNTPDYSFSDDGNTYINFQNLFAGPPNGRYTRWLDNSGNVLMQLTQAGDLYVLRQNLTLSTNNKFFKLTLTNNSQVNILGVDAANVTQVGNSGSPIRLNSGLSSTQWGNSQSLVTDSSGNAVTVVGSESVILPLAPNATPPSGTAAYIDTSASDAKLVFSNTYVGRWQFQAPRNYSGNLQFDIMGNMQTANSGNVVVQSRIWALASGTSASMGTENFDTANIVTTAVPGTARWPFAFTIVCTNNSSLAAGKWFMVELACNSVPSSSLWNMSSWTMNYTK
jgi:hypothetical protein